MVQLVQILRYLEIMERTQIKGAIGKDFVALMSVNNKRVQPQTSLVVAGSRGRLAAAKTVQSAEKLQ